MTLSELFLGFLQVGARGFGGAMPWARRMLVDERRWLTAEEFTDVLSLGQVLPGPNIVNVSVAVGSRYHGLRGAVVAVAGLMALPVAIVLVLAVLYSRFGQIPAIDAMLRGVGAAASGMVLGTGLRMCAPLVRAPLALVFLVAAFAGVALLRWPLVPMLFGLAPVSVLAAWARRS